MYKILKTNGEFGLLVKFLVYWNLIAARETESDETDYNLVGIADCRRDLKTNNGRTSRLLNFIG